MFSSCSTYPNTGTLTFMPFVIFNVHAFFNDALSGGKAVEELDDEGNTWMLYHAFELTNLGAQRQVLLDKVLWDEEGWPYVKDLHPSYGAYPPVIK